MSSQTTVRPQSTPVAGVLRRIPWVVPVAAAAATAADLGFYYAAGILFPEVAAWPGAGPLQIVGANLAYFVVGALTLLFLARFSKRPARAFVIASTIGLLMSFGAPISAGFGDGSGATPAASMATIATLSLLHVGSYAVGVPMLVRLALTRKGE